MVAKSNELNFRLNPDWFQFDHHWKLKEIHPEYQMDLFELDDLPDPRLYNIDVTKLRQLARSACSECGSMFEASYENYMLKIEKEHLEMTMADNFIFNEALIVNRHLDNLLNLTLTKPNPIIIFFPAMLHPSNIDTRKLEINRALNKFVIRLSVHIEAKTWYDSLNNV